MSTKHAKEDKQIYLKFYRILCLSLLFFSHVCSAQNNQFFKVPNTLTVCSYAEFKPISYGEGEGYEADILRAIAKFWNIDIQFYPENIFDGIWRLPSKKYTTCDVSIGGISKTENRIKEGTRYSIPTLSFKQSLLVRKKDFESGIIHGYSDFKTGKSFIGIVPGTTGAAYAHKRAEEENVDVKVFKFYPNESEALLALKQGKIDAIARGEIGNEYQASLDDKLVVIAQKDYGESFAFVVNKENPELLENINIAISIITDHGNITFAKWLKKPCIFTRKGPTN